MQVRQGAHRRTQGAHVLLGFFHTERTGGGFDIELRPVGAQHGFHAHLLDGLHHAREPPQFAFGLLDVLPRNIFLDVFHIFQEFFALALEDRLPAVGAFLTLVQIGGIIPVIQLERTGMHFENRIAGFIEKITIMRNNDRRTIPLGKITLEPFDRGNIEMICRLIQQQQIRIR